MAARDLRLLMMSPTEAVAGPVHPEQLAPHSGALRLLAVATFSSGGCALLLEQIYEKYLSTLLGASRPAATIVLATFFLGLALGGVGCPKETAGARRRLAILELFIAAWAVLVGLGFFASYDYAAGWLATAGGTTGTLTAARFALALFWILPPTVAMGAQLPTLTAVLDSLGGRTADRLTRYYALNLLGGFVFTVAAPVLLFNYLGALGALWVAAGVSAAISAALWFGLPPSVYAPAVDTPAVRSDDGPGRAEAGLAALSGFVFFALEVIWFHLISSVLGASTYSFSILLAIVLGGLAIAGWQMPRLAGQPPAAALFGVLARVAPLLVVSSAAWPHLARVMSSIQTRIQLESFWAGEALKLAVVAVAVLPVAIGLGMVFPLVLRGVDERGAPGSRRVGWICALNVAGCVIGALTAGFGLIPGVGAEHALTILSLSVLLAAAVLAWRFRGGPRQDRLSLPWLAVAAVALLALPRWDRLELTRGIGVYLHDGMPRDARLVYLHEDHHTGFVTVVQTPGGVNGPVTHTLLQNGKFDADDSTQVSAQIGIGLLGALHVPGRDHALVIGCGSGQTAAVIDAFGFRHLEIVELSPGHLAAARQYFGPINRGILDQPQVETIVEDGRNWLLRSRHQYDLIQIEISSIWFAGATNLYSREFYESVRRRLAPGGVLVQWFQLHHLTEREIRSIIGTLQRVLPEVSAWQAGLQACVIASVEPQTWNEDALARWREAPDFAAERKLLERDIGTDPRTWTLASPEAVRRFLAGGPVVINDDRNRWLEFQTPKHYLSRRDHVDENLQMLRAAAR